MSETAVGIPRTEWNIECRDKDGNLKWTEDVKNLVTNEGVNHLLTQYFKGSLYSAAWYVGLIKAPATIAASDTAESHIGWAESTDYSGLTRPQLALGPIGNKTANNSSNKSLFTMTAATTIAGMFLISDSTKGGTAGTMYSAVAFSGGDRPLSIDDVLAVTITVRADTGA